MTIRQEINDYGDSFVSVLASPDGLEAGRNIDIASSLYPIQKIFPPGMWAGTHTGNTSRILPRARLAVLAPDEQRVIQLTDYMAGVFVVGDVLDTITFTGSVPNFANLGTIAAVDTLNHRITMAADLAADLPIGTVIGVEPSIPIGLLSPNTAIDAGLLKAQNSHFGVFTKAKVVRARLPYHDPQVLNLSGCQYTVREVP